MTGAAIGMAVGGIGSTIAGISQTNQADKTQRDAMARLQQQSQAMIKFNQEQLDDWENTFGGLENNLTDYYSNLDPTKFATQGKQELASNLQKHLTQVNETLSAQGLQSAGMRSQAAKEAAFAQATGNAQIDMAAPEQVAQMQQGYLNSKEHRRTNAVAGINNARGSAMTGQYNAASNYSQQQAQSGAGFMGAGGNLIGSALGLGIQGGMFGNSGGGALGGAGDAGGIGKL